MRQRIRAVLRWSQAYEFVEHNVAGDAIDGALPRARPPVRHHAALAYEDAPDAWQRIEPIGAARPLPSFPDTDCHAERLKRGGRDGPRWTWTPACG